MNAGSGPHLISYTYNQQNCSFVTSDTIQVLSQLTVDVINTRAVAPPYEACITDSLRFLLSNFIAASFSNKFRLAITRSNKCSCLAIMI